MLKLKKVELLGFKSFCEKTAITFSGTGLTCIVGPNGCGKSNIVDAISWVLGEQSHKSLRAERMADCIFNGTQKRPPMGLSEVSLTLVDPELVEAAEKVMDKAEAEQSQAPDVQEMNEVNEVQESESSTSFTSSTSSTSPAESEGSADTARGKKQPKPGMHLKPGEIVIGRRLYRSGQSEYLINGRVARLRDIQEIFMGTGLGPDSYAIIEQGRIGQILSSKPMDRRAIIEEAAGVTKYKTKKRLAEAKLESSKLNLSRVNDILVEVEKQLGSLKRQASKARRYAEIREQMRGIQRQVLASKAAALDTEAERLAQLVRGLNETEQQHMQALGGLEAEQQRLAARGYELESEIRQNQNLLGQHALELDRAENRIVFNRERTRELQTRSAQLSTELEVVRQQAASAAADAQAHEQNVVALRTARQDLEILLQQIATLVQNLAADQMATEARIAELRAQVGRLSEDVTRLHGEHAQAVEGLTHHLEAQQRAEQVEQQVAAEAERLRSRADAAEMLWQSAESHARALGQSVRDAQARVVALRGEKQETLQRSDRTREELSSARARRSMLEQILNDRAYTAEAVQKLFAANGEGSTKANGFRAVGVLADYAEVQEQYEVAVEQFLRDELEYVVVETFDHARAGISLLREEMGGRATFFVDSLRHLKLTEGEPLAPFHANVGVVSRLDRLVEFRDPLGAAAKQFVPKLQTAYLVETGVVAEQLARENPKYQFVTLDGTCYNGRMVSGGRPGEAGPLAMKRELRILEAQAMQLERAAAEAQAALKRLEGELDEQERHIEEAIAQHVEAEKTLVTATHQREQAQTELARAEQLLAECRSEIARLRADADAARARAEQARERQGEAAQSRVDAEVDIVASTEKLSAMRQAAQARQEELVARREEMATVAERLGSAESVAERLASELNELRERERALTEQRAALEREQEELAASTVELEQRAQILRAEKERLEQRRAELEQEWEQARTRTVEVDDALRMARQKLGDLREERSQHEVERARNESDRNHLREMCLADLNAHPEDLIAQTTPEEMLIGEALLTAETSYHEMRARIEAMGPVNMMALEEYQECEQRYEFLTRERDDLLKSIEDTLQTIKELDEVSRQRFEEAFRVINANFAEVFRTLFGGGTAEMRLGEYEGTSDPGIDMIAQPPGKRLQNVLLLSGGEKALTALALLIAIFRYQPSPFCILDEVDAPLDEANVGRFAKLVSDMSEKTQFIVVTHNKRTMEMAPVLYGVTMQEPGVSKLVSVRWDEPQEAAPTAA